MKHTLKSKGGTKRKLVFEPDSSGEQISVYYYSDPIVEREYVGIFMTTKTALKKLLAKLS